MALSAVLSTPLTTVPAEYQVQCYITVSNSAAYPVTVKQIRAAIKSTPISFLEDKSSYVAAFPGSSGQQIPAGGSMQFLMQVIFHGANNGGSYDVPNVNGTTYDMGCRIFGADGSVIVPTPIAMTVTQNSQEI
jgi:hypothetical protein